MSLAPEADGTSRRRPVSNRARVLVLLIGALVYGGMFIPLMIADAIDPREDSTHPVMMAARVWPFLYLVPLFLAVPAFAILRRKQLVFELALYGLLGFFLSLCIHSILTPAR